MNEIYYITKRNCYNFFRDKSAVFFSMLSMFIVIGLMVIFIGSMNSESVYDLIQTFGGTGNVIKDKANSVHYIQLWTLGGVLCVNAVTVTMTAIGAMVQDEARKKIMSFYVTPVKRSKLTIGYVVSAWVIGTIMCSATLVLAQAYFAIIGEDLLPILDVLKLVGLVAMNTLVFAAVGYLIVLFIHSESALSGVLTIVGTLVGFAGGIYLSVGSMSDFVQAVVKALPVIHGAAMMRVVATQDAIDKIFVNVPAEVMDEVKEDMGITVTVGDHVLKMQEQMLIMLGYVMIAVVVSILINRKRKLKDR